MDKIYLIPGLGADTRTYNHIGLPENYDVIPTNWVTPDKIDTLYSYAQKLIKQCSIKTDSIIIGNSLGGMIAVEIAKQIPVKKLILISSIKTSDEAPRYFKLFRALPVYRLIPRKLFNALDFLVEVVFGQMNKEDAWLFKDMLKKTSPDFIKWAIEAALHWQNSYVPPNLYQITGDKDRVFSWKKMNGAQIVRGGAHIMIFDKSKEVNRLLKAILRKK